MSNVVHNKAMRQPEKPALKMLCSVCESYYGWLKGDTVMLNYITDERFLCRKSG